MTYRELLKNSLDKCWFDELKDAEGKTLSRGYWAMPLGATWFMQSIAALMCYTAVAYLVQDEGKTMTSGKARTQPTIEDYAHYAQVIVCLNAMQGTKLTHTFHKFFTWLFDQEFEYPDDDLSHMWNSYNVLEKKWKEFLNKSEKEETK